MEVVKIGWRYAVRNKRGEYWWSGVSPNWTENTFYCTKFWFKWLAVRMAIRLGAHPLGIEVVWRAQNDHDA